MRYPAWHKPLHWWTPWRLWSLHRELRRQEKCMKEAK